MPCPRTCEVSGPDSFTSSEATPTTGLRPGDAPSERDLLPDGIAFEPHARERLVHHDDWLAARDVRRLEVPAADEPRLPPEFARKVRPPPPPSMDDLAHPLSYPLRDLRTRRDHRTERFRPHRANGIGASWRSVEGASAQPIGTPDVQSAEAAGPKRHEAHLLTIVAERRHRLEEWRVQRIDVDGDPPRI
jgi:hypothetical protein